VLTDPTIILVVRAHLLCRAVQLFCLPLQQMMISSKMTKNTNTDLVASLSATSIMISLSALDQIAIAARGNEITGLEIFEATADDTTADRAIDLIAQMNADRPLGGTEMSYGNQTTQHLRFWKGDSCNAPIVVFVHGGSWRTGTYLDSLGSAKVTHFTSKGYAFATVNYTLIPSVIVEEQIQEVANSVGFLVKRGTSLGIDPRRLILMGHSSGAHVVTLLGTDSSYLERAGVSIDSVRAVISLDGSNYNAIAEITDSPGPVAENLIFGLGTVPKRLRAMSPTYHTQAPNARAFLLLHVQRHGDIRQAVELDAALNAAGTNTSLHVFEGESFEGHVQMLLRIGDPVYPATLVLDKWLKKYV
jgi:acetyl esterase/lipase